MLWSYNGQIKRYVTQLMRLMSNFPVKDGKGQIRQVPVTYGNISRQVAHILKDNSENKIPSAPRISVYITDLQLDRDRLTDSSHVHKVNVRERAFDEVTGKYTSQQGPGYTVERLMPTPYTLKCNADIWASNTDQKLQLLEQILVWFNPSLEIQTTDNFVDWTSLTVVDLDNITYSNNSVPVGIDNEIDVGTLSFSIPIYISTPAKVKKMGVITNVIASIFNEDLGSIEEGVTSPEVFAYDDSLYSGAETVGGTRIARSSVNDNQVNSNYGQYAIFVSGDTVQLISNGKLGEQSWLNVIEAHPGEYQENIGRIYLNNYDNDSFYVGVFSVDEDDSATITVSWDTDSLPSDTVITSSMGDGTTVDYIIDPLDFNPESVKSPGLRLLILGNVGDDGNTSGARAWKNNDGSDLVAGANDIIEWTGSAWQVVFDASSAQDPVFVTTLSTGKQYKFTGEEWLLSVDGKYPEGTWRIEL